MNLELVHSVVIRGCVLYISESSNLLILKFLYPYVFLINCNVNYYELY